jgi:hypothetical protein
MNLFVSFLGDGERQSKGLPNTLPFAPFVATVSDSLHRQRHFIPFE